MVSMSRADLPPGTVSWLFSDVEGSTALLSRLGPAYGGALDAQPLAMRAIRRKKPARGLNGPTGAYFCPKCKGWHLTSKSRTQTPPWEKGRSMRRSRASGAS